MGPLVWLVLTTREEYELVTNRYCWYHICFHIFLDSDSDTDGYRIQQRYGLSRVRIRINIYRIRVESDADSVSYEYFFRYWVKATSIYTTCATVIWPLYES
jgi:hypothetical protein